MSPLRVYKDVNGAQSRFLPFFLFQDMMVCSVTLTSMNARHLKFAEMERVLILMAITTVIVRLDLQEMGALQ